MERRFFLLFSRALLLFCLVGASAFANEEVNPTEEAVQALSEDEPEDQFSKVINDTLNESLGHINGFVYNAIFFDISMGAFEAPRYSKGAPVLRSNGQPEMRTIQVPFIVALLGLSGIFFTLYFKFINFRGFKHAIDIVRGKFDHDDDEGEISHFRALTSALSATVGLGNIAGVAIAIQLGGPGAVFWMFVASFFGMAIKFSSCTLAQLFRQKNKDGSVSGGPMYYIDLGISQRGGSWKWIGKGLGITYALMLIAGSMGGGNMFQANQSYEALQTAFHLEPGSNIIFGIVLAFSVGLVILGGIQRIGAATSKIVPLMVVSYLLASLFVLFANAEKIPGAFALIFRMAFSDNAAYGGAIGVLVWGIRRASFSNEAGLGSSAIAHAAAKTDEPVREGLVAMLEPFIDTMVVCTMTALVVIVSGAWNDPSVPDKAGVALTTNAFATVLPWFPVLLSICVLLFAYSTMISWAYYGERGWIYLLDHFGGRGVKTLGIYRTIFVFFVFVGSVAKLGAVLDFSDLLILCMALPNIIGSLLLAPDLKKLINAYWQRMKQTPTA